MTLIRTALLFPLMLATASAQDTHANPAEHAQVLVSRALQDSQDIQEMSDNAGSPLVRRQIRQKSQDMEATLRELEQVVQGFQGMSIHAGGVDIQIVTPPATGVRPAPVVGELHPVPMPHIENPETLSDPVACDTEQLQAIETALEEESFSDAKLALLQEISLQHSFDVAQVKELLEAFSFGDDKVEAAALLHPRIVDPENWFQVYEAFDFETDKEALRARVAE